MSFQRVVEKVWNEHRLFSVLLELTYRCNLDCFFCYNDVKLEGRPLAREQYFDLLRDLAAMHVFAVSLSGGEPLSHPDFLSIGARARELGFVVRIKSNGHAFRGPLAKRIREEIDPFMVEVSLHGATAQVHDRQTRVPGSFERLQANLREMKGLGFRVRLNSALTRWNEDEVEKMFGLADELGFPIFFDPEVTIRDDGSQEPLEIAASREGLGRLFQAYKTRAEAEAKTGTPRTGAAVGRLADDGVSAPKGEKFCGAGNSTLTIDPYGNVYPCVQWRVPVGSLHESSIREIWAGPGPLQEIRDLSPAIKKSVEALGEAGGFMSFCPGAAHAQTGSPFAVLPTVQARTEAIMAVHRPGAALRLPAFLNP